MKRIRARFDIFQSETRRSLSPKDLLMKEKALLESLETGTIYGQPIPNFKHISDPSQLTAMEARFAPFKASFSDYEPAKADIKRISDNIKELEKAQKEYESMKRAVAEHVGELILQIREDEGRAAEKVRRSAVLSNAMKVASAQKLRSTFGAAIARTNRTRRAANTAAYKALFEKETAVGRNIQRLWRGFTGRKTAAAARAEKAAAAEAAAVAAAAAAVAAAAAAAAEAKRATNAVTKIQGLWKMRAAKTALKTLKRQKQRLNALAKGRATVARRRAMTSTERRAENEAKAAAKVAETASRRAARNAETARRKAEKNDEMQRRREEEIDRREAEWMARRAVRNAETARRRAAKAASKAKRGAGDAGGAGNNA
jgi:SWI/SNF-related matrix-associated actin-dependent regulator 1 of chromatin subfamily A